MTGQRFGLLTVLSLAGSHPSSRAALWACLCDCGASAVVAGTELRGGKTKSCGCVRRAIGKIKTLTHGESKKGQWSREYRAWSNMHWRVKNPKDAKYYSDRGITVCERWKSFENFLADMGRKPSPLHSLDRINNDGNYEPSNCRWATLKEQRRNQRRCQKLEQACPPSAQ